MIIDCISDLHGHFPKLDGGDLLIVAGDLTSNDQPPAWATFLEWLCDCTVKYEEIVVISGNHDNALQYGFNLNNFCPNVYYLCDSGTETTYYDDRFPQEDEGFLPSGKSTLKIWGSPWAKRFPGMNPHCMAFTVDTDEELAKKWALIPPDTDILVTHCPAWGMRDGPDPETRYGSKSLLHWVAGHVNTLKLHVCGHIHEGYGHFDIRGLQTQFGDPTTTVFINCSHVNERSQPVNKPIRIEL